MANDDIVLSYYDAIIRKSDYKLLNTKDWINDQLIEFWLEYITNDLFKEYKEKFLCLSPSLSHLIKLTSNLEMVKSLLETLDIADKELLLIPINDHKSFETVGGTHWTLLVFVKCLQTFQHYDSANSANINDACLLARKLQKIYYPNIHFNMESVCCHSQENAYNCGIHLICNVKAICIKYLKNDSREITDIVPVKTINSFRQELINIIDSLK